MGNLGHRGHQWWPASVPRVVLDVLVGGFIVVVNLVAVVLGQPAAGAQPAVAGRPVRVLDVLAVAVAFGLVLARRWRPPVVLAVAATLSAAATAGSEDLSGSFVMVTAVAAYTVATRTDRATAWLACGGAAGLIYVTTVVMTAEDWFGPALAILAWIGMATAVGDATRIRRAYIAAVEERAHRAEQTREEEARRRVAEERLRIARDLHDAVAHHIAVVNLHAGLAGHTLRTQPDQAETSLVHVREAAQTVLDELATILSVLRQTDDDDAPTDPVRGLSRLTDLLDSLAAAGHRVQHRQVGTRRPLPEAIDQAAYRIVQEALTNAHKHGVDDTADLRIEYRPDTVVLEITNPTVPSAGRPETPGHGLTGMRERATAVGGTLTAEPAGVTRFRVHAELPAGPS